MASLCRSALVSSSRSIATRSQTLTQKSLCAKALSSPLFSSPTAIPRASRVLSALGSVESMMPLHSAVASARLRSNIAVDSSCWSSLSQGDMLIYRVKKLIAFVILSLYILAQSM